MINHRAPTPSVPASRSAGQCAAAALAVTLAAPLTVLFRRRRPIRVPGERWQI
jgi:hypothetical protein